jgi:hypothetical protein
LGNDAVWLKWRLFKDPYANVGAFDLVRALLAKLAAFYVSLAALSALLLKTRRGRRLLLLIAVAALPHIGMALAFESGSPERYLPALPFVLMGFGFVIADTGFRLWVRIAAAALCCAHIPANLLALSATAADASTRADAGRIAPLVTLNPASRVFVIEGSDGVFVLRHNRLFHPINREPLPDIVSIVPLGPRVPSWRRDFGCNVFSAWDRGGEVWISERVLAERPLRNWLWVEGDDRRLGWSAIRAFFLGLNRGEERGGADGFFRIPNDSANRSVLLAGIRAGEPGGCPNPAPSQ